MAERKAHRAELVERTKLPPRQDWSTLKEGDEIDTEELRRLLKTEPDDPAFMPLMLHVAREVQAQNPHLYISAKGKRIRALKPDDAVIDNAESTLRHANGLIRQHQRFTLIPRSRLSDEVKPIHASLDAAHTALQLDMAKQAHRLRCAAALKLPPPEEPDEE